MHNFLTFSDSAKYADIARNIVNGLGFGNSFSFWCVEIFEIIKTNVFSPLSTPPVMPFSIAGLFKIFGISDFAVIATSFLYFILTLVFVYLLGKKIFKSNLVGILSTLAVGFNYDLIHYATSGASESPFIFEIVAATYFASMKKKWATILTLLFFILMYFTRPQSFIYILGIILYLFLINFKTKKALMFFIGVLLAGLAVDWFILVPLYGKYFLYSFISRGIGTATRVISGNSVSDSLRGSVAATIGFLPIFKKAFYNLYNFYKLLPDIMNPYLFALFAIGLLIKAKDRIVGSFKIASVFMVLITFLIAATSIPFFRYLHPIIPLVYVVAVGTLIGILELKITKQKFVILASTLLILLFGVGQTLGVLILDSRFERNTHNVGKPPVYVELSKILKENTDPNQVVVTNLDTWGSWYGERKTVWFPVEPKQLFNPATESIPFDAIYLTSYLMDDANYYMDDNWRMIFENPKDPKKWTCDGCSEIANEFKLKSVYKVDSNDNYERQDAKSVLLIKK